MWPMGRSRSSATRCATASRCAWRRSRKCWASFPGELQARSEMSGSRGTIFLEQARVLSQLAYDAEQFVLRLAAPRCAAHAAPGSFAHITCDASIPMRRPLSIMRADAQAGWIDVLYKVVGQGLRALAA